MIGASGVTRRTGWIALVGGCKARGRLRQPATKVGLCLAATLAFVPMTGQAQPAGGEGEFAYVTELLKEGFEPFAVSGAGALFGMQKKGVDIYLCFSLDTEEAAEERRTTLTAELAGEAESRWMPNIPVVCIMTE